MIIAFVGIDGTGKTTLLSLFEKYLKKNNKQVQTFKALKSETRFLNNYNMIKQEFLKDNPNMQHYFNVISSHLMSFDLFQQSEYLKEINNEDNVILLDRWAICQKLYSQVWMAENEFSKLVYKACLVPDLTFVLDCDMDVVKKRLDLRGGPNEFENYLVLRRLKRQYLRYVETDENAVLIQNNGALDYAFQKMKKYYENKSKYYKLGSNHITIGEVL